MLRGTLRARCATSLFLLGWASSPAFAQSNTAKGSPGQTAAGVSTSVQLDVTQIEALVRYPAFFHNRAVAVVGTVRSAGDSLWLESLVGNRVRVTRLTGAVPGTQIQVRGTFFDVGRLKPGDELVGRMGLDATIDRSKPGLWPAPGALLVIRPEKAAVYSPPTYVSIQSVTLDPDRYEKQSVSIVGQFRGRNLVGDLPAAPNVDKWEFVVRNGASSLWIVGRRPQGSDFSLDPAAPKDVGRWLRISGTVSKRSGLVCVDAEIIERGESEPETGPAELSNPLPPQPPPEVTFSVPIEAETDVALKTIVRIQFSRVMKGDSFAGRVRASYIDRPPQEAPPVRDPEFIATYMPKDQVLVVTFARPLERFRAVKVELLDGVSCPDGSSLKPWTLTFTTGAK